MLVRTDMEKGVVGSMHECGVTESYKLKRQVILSASEAAEMILRVDDSESSRLPQTLQHCTDADPLPASTVLRAAPRRREGHH